MPLLLVRYSTTLFLYSTHNNQSVVSLKKEMVMKTLVVVVCGSLCNSEATLPVTILYPFSVIYPTDFFRILFCYDTSVPEMLTGSLVTNVASIQYVLFHFSCFCHDRSADKNNVGNKNFNDLVTLSITMETKLAHHCISLQCGKKYVDVVRFGKFNVVVI